MVGLCVFDLNGFISFLLRYDYQNRERRFMNSSTMPDKVWPEEHFRDHFFAEKAASRLDKFVRSYV
jgi:hypothetical protein